MKILSHLAFVLLGFVLGVAALILVYSGGYLDKIDIGFLLNASSPSRAITGEEKLGENYHLVERAYEADRYIYLKNYEELSKMVHPEYGVIFVPYSTISLETNQHFSASQVSQFASNTAKYIWGVEDGSGEAIDLTVEQYFDRFLCRIDFTDAPILGVNTIARSGNTVENVEEIFPNAKFVDFYFPGFVDEYGGIDWETQRLVFEEYNGELMLTAIIHCAWTI